MDTLSNILTSIRIETSKCVRLEFGGQWGFRFRGYNHAHFGVINHGSCWLSVMGAEQAIPLSEGDCWVLPRGETHVLMSSPMTHIRPYDEIRYLKHGGLLRYSEKDEPVTTIFVGNFTLDEHACKCLTDSLPNLITFRMDRENPPLEMQAILQILFRESQSEDIGSALISSRVADILFVQAIRAYVEECGDEAAGWLRALTDERLSAALGVIHGAIDKRWTVASLAAVAGLSRSGFAARFKDVLRETPLDYLTRLRMYKAAQLLREYNTRVGEVANLVGYQSEAAFSKAFKKSIGVAPGRYKNDFEHPVNESH